jgi:hypothetical protein
MVVAYVRQETIDPVKDLGRFLAYGLGAVILGGLGLVLLMLGGLRLLQAETGSAFTGHLSFIPYLCPFVVCLVVAGIAVKRIGSGAPQPGKAKP